MGITVPALVGVGLALVIVAVLAIHAWRAEGK